MISRTLNLQSPSATHFDRPYRLPTRRDYRSLSNDISDVEDDAQSKMNLYFTREIRKCLDLFSTPVDEETCSSYIPNGNTKQQPSSFAFPRLRRTWSFHVVLPRTAKKCTKIYNARAQLLFCSLNLLFGDVLVVVVEVVCSTSLMPCFRLLV